MKCAECPAEITGMAGQIGRGKKAKVMCLRCYRKYAKRPPPLPTDVLSNAPQSTREGLKGSRIVRD